MAKRDFEKLVLQVRLDTKEKALQGAILVPWRRLEGSATTYADWHIFVLWVRTIAEHEDQLPEIVRSALADRCPGFLESRQEQAPEQRFLWHSLEEWIAAREFAQAKKEGWFDAVMYYAYKDLRTEQAWSLWERTKDAWNHKRPSQWPTLEEWKAQVIATHTLIQVGTEKALSVEALARVERERIQGAAAELLVSRAVALWVACIHDLRNPAKIIGVGDSWILQPEDPWEITGYVHNVVFTCGAVPEADGTVKIYWGGADTVMCVGEANVSDLVALCREHGRLPR